MVTVVQYYLVSDKHFSALLAATREPAELGFFLLLVLQSEVKKFKVALKRGKQVISKR